MSSLLKQQLLVSIVVIFLAAVTLIFLIKFGKRQESVPANGDVVGETANLEAASRLGESPKS
jgi:hypothetical protein